jgi:acetyl-CoA acyltransferase
MAMEDVFIAGAYVTTFGKFPDKTLRMLATEAVTGALADAGCGPDEIDAVYFANAAEGLLTGQEMIRGQVVLDGTGLEGKPVINCENACASGSTAAHLAFTAVQSGAADVALALGAEKLTNPDRARTFAVFQAGWDVERFGGPDGKSDQSAFMSTYADMARQYMARSGATIEDFAAVSVKSHANGALNPNAQYRDPLTVDEVLASRVIDDPLRLLMCSPIGDGASGVVVANHRGLARLDAEPVRVLAAALRSGSRDESETPVIVAARAAYEHAGIRPDDLDVLEIHDAAAPAELMVTEELGLAGPGEGLALFHAGATRIGGRFPINPGGGLLSRGHPIGATGCAQLTELVDQLRGRCGARQVEDAKIALAENAGGWLGGKGPAVSTITILGRDGACPGSEA